MVTSAAPLEQKSENIKQSRVINTKLLILTKLASLFLLNFILLTIKYILFLLIQIDNLAKVAEAYLTTKVATYKIMGVLYWYSLSRYYKSILILEELKHLFTVNNLSSIYKRVSSRVAIRITQRFTNTKVTNITFLSNADENSPRKDKNCEIKSGQELKVEVLGKNTLDQSLIVNERNSAKECTKSSNFEESIDSCNSNSSLDKESPDSIKEIVNSESEVVEWQDKTEVAFTNIIDSSSNNFVSKYNSIEDERTNSLKDGDAALNLSNQVKQSYSLENYSSKNYNQNYVVNNSSIDNKAALNLTMTKEKTAKLSRKPKARSAKAEKKKLEKMERKNQLKEIKTVE